MCKSLIKSLARVQGTDVFSSASSSAYSSRVRFWRVAFLVLRVDLAFSDDEELSSLYLGAVVVV